MTALCQARQYLTVDRLSGSGIIDKVALRLAELAERYQVQRVQQSLNFKGLVM